MKIFILIVGILSVLALITWVISRRSASQRHRAEADRANVREHDEDETASKQTRSKHRADYERQTAQAERDRVAPKVKPNSELAELEARRRRRQARRDQEDGLANAEGYEGFVVEPTLADDLMTGTGPSWRDLPESYRELQDPPKHDPAPSSPSEDTSRWTPTFDNGGYDTPASTSTYTPDPAPYSPPSSNDSPPSYSGD